MAIDDPCFYLADIDRQHVAEIFALQALCVARLRGVELGHPGLGVIAADLIARQTPEQLKRYAAMPWEEAIGETARELYAYIHQQSPHTVCLPRLHGMLQ